MGNRRTPAPDRRDRILEGARQAFLRFGFERSSMADIAAGSGVSRTALYHYFPGKEDVLQALIAKLHSQTHAIAIRALEQSVSLDSALRGLLDAKFGRALELMSESPNGIELVDATHRLTGPATRAADEEFYKLVVTAMVRYGREHEAGAEADALVAAAKGMMRSGVKHVSKKQFDDRIGRLVRWLTT